MIELRSMGEVSFWIVVLKGDTADRNSYLAQSIGLGFGRVLWRSPDTGSVPRFFERVQKYISGGNPIFHPCPILPL